jgi:putative spermidine/putrescine transport system permease protein
MRVGYLLVPGIAFLFFTFLVPLLLLLSRSFYEGGFTAEYYVRILTTPSYLRIIWTSIEIAALSTIATMLLAYPVSYYLIKVGSGLRSLMIAMIIVPFWTNILVRCYSWIVVLQKRGLVNALLTDQLGLTNQPIELVYNRVGVLIGMTHYLLPPAILILYSVNRTIDLKLSEAAQGLGASAWKAFTHVFFPMSLPGVRAATLLVMILGLGFFVTPALLGGRLDITLAMLINNQFSETTNWGLGAALSTVLLVMTTIGIAAHYQALPRLGRRVAP